MRRVEAELLRFDRQLGSYCCHCWKVGALWVESLGHFSAMMNDEWVGIGLNWMRLGQQQRVVREELVGVVGVGWWGRGEDGRW